MVTTTAGRSLALASAALLTTLSCATAAHADQQSGSAHGRHLGQAKHSGATPQPTTSPSASPSASPSSAAHTPRTKKPHPAHPAKGPHQGATPSPTPGAGDPPGNNGTVKIAAVGDLDRIPNNTPHPGCSFEVQWYGFDGGSDVVSTVTFAPQAPTKDVAISVDGPTSVPVGEDAASGAGTSTGLDAVQTYTLAFSGEAPAKQGYHVRLTVATPRSQGNDTKTKVFWVGPCDTASPTQAAAPSAGATPTPGLGSVGDTGQTVTTGPAADTVPQTGILAAPPAAADTATGGAAVPTAIDAGKAHHGVAAWVRSPLPLVIVGLGALLGVLGLVLRRRA